MPKPNDEVTALQGQVVDLRSKILDLQIQNDLLASEFATLRAVAQHARHCYTLWMQGELTRQNGMMTLDRLLREAGQ